MKSLQHPLLCFMGPSASGKTFISEKILGKSQKVITTTTRKKRPLEKNGVDYYFVSEKTFEALKKQEAFFETDAYAGCFYGTQKQEIFNKTKDKLAFAIVTVPGFYHLKEEIFPLIPIYLKIDEKTFLTRLKRRHLSVDETKKRIQAFRKEAQQLVQLKKDLPQLIVLDNNANPEVTLYKLKEKLHFYLT